MSKIFRHRMEDPDPLEKVCPDIPPAFAAIVFKAMAKSPEDRHQTALELRADLARWTDTRTLQHSSAGSTRSFRPPPPELDDDDFRIDVDPSQFSGLGAIRDLGEAEISAPLSKPPLQPRAAVILRDEELDDIDDENEGEAEAVDQEEEVFDDELEDAGPSHPLPRIPLETKSDDDWVVRITFTILGIVVVLILLAVMISNF